MRQVTRVVLLQSKLIKCDENSSVVYGTRKLIYAVDFSVFCRYMRQAR